MSVNACTLPVLFSVWKVECSFAFMLDGDSTKKGVLFWMLLWEQYTFQSCSSVSLWHSHLHSMTQSVFALALKTTRASQLLSHFSQGVESFFFLSDLYDFMLYKPQRKTIFALKKGHPSFLVYLSLHLNISALCTCCLYTREEKNPQT